jgi:hypothetical protein
MTTTEEEKEEKWWLPPKWFTTTAINPIPRWALTYVLDVNRVSELVDCLTEEKYILASSQSIRWAFVPGLFGLCVLVKHNLWLLVFLVQEYCLTFRVKSDLALGSSIVFSHCVVLLPFTLWTVFVGVLLYGETLLSMVTLALVGTIVHRFPSYCIAIFALVYFKAFLIDAKDFTSLARLPLVILLVFF